MNENFKEPILRLAFVDPSYAISQKSNVKDAGVEIDLPQNNSSLAKEGEYLCKNYIRALLNFWYPKLPTQGVE